MPRAAASEGIDMTDADGAAGAESGWGAGRSNILVAVRARPLSENERKRRDEEVLSVPDASNINIKDPGHTATNQMRQKRLRERRYAFDHAFGPSVGTDRVYQHTVRHLIDGVLGGYNGTVFAYGATGSGKTFTMLGTPGSPGVMVRTLADLYQRMDERAAGADGTTFRVTLSYVEVYNENIRDLLSSSASSSSSSSDEYLELREDPVKGNCVAGVTEHAVRDSAAVLALLSEGNRRRMQEPTAANRESSRSHAVLQIVIAGRDAYGSKLRTGKLSLIDLAGSERAANTQNRGIRLLEGANINRSLLALGNCITALANKGAFVPYRDSKLTRLLKDSLGGNARTVMISCVSPAASSFEETCNTLKYANRAKNIKTSPAPKVAEGAAFQASEYDNLISGLRQEVAVLKNKLAEATVPAGGLAALLEEGGGGGDDDEGGEDREGDDRSPRVGGAGGLTARRAGGVGGGGGSPSGAGVLFGMGGGARGVSGISGAVAAGPVVVSAAALASPALMRKTMRSLHAAAGAGGAGGMGAGAGGYASDAVDAAAALAAAGGAIVIPEGYVLVHAAEAAAAAEKLESLRQALLANFQERMQVRRSLVELQATNTENAAEAARKAAALERVQATMTELEGRARAESLPSGGGAAGGSGSAHGGVPSQPSLPASPSTRRLVERQAAAAVLRREISELQDANVKNAKVRADLVARLER